jgi:hypothetical protein
VGEADGDGDADPEADPEAEADADGDGDGESVGSGVSDAAGIEGSGTEVGSGMNRDGMPAIDSTMTSRKIATTVRIHGFANRSWRMGRAPR